MSNEDIAKESLQVPQYCTTLVARVDQYERALECIGAQ